MAHIPAERCLGIIELLADGAGNLPLGEIAERLNLPKSGAHRLLATLVDLGWAEQDPETSFYRLTMRLAVLGQRFYAASGLPHICQPLLDRLANQCQGVRAVGGGRWQFAGLVGARARRIGGIGVSPCGNDGHGAAVCDG